MTTALKNGEVPSFHTTGFTPGSVLDGGLERLRDFMRYVVTERGGESLRRLADQIGLAKTLISKRTGLRVLARDRSVKLKPVGCDVLASC